MYDFYRLDLIHFNREVSTVQIDNCCIVYNKKQPLDFRHVIKMKTEKWEVFCKQSSEAFYFCDEHNVIYKRKYGWETENANCSAFFSFSPLQPTPFDQLKMQNQRHLFYY